MLTRLHAHVGCCKIGSKQTPTAHSTRISQFAPVHRSRGVHRRTRCIMQAKTGVQHASLYSANSRHDQLGPQGIESMFVNQQGLKIATYFWPADNPSSTKAVVLGVHGHGAHLQNEYLKRQVCLQSRSGLISLQLRSGTIHNFWHRLQASPSCTKDRGYKRSTRLASLSAALTSRA